MRAFGITDKGVKREKNEDSILLNDALMLYIVADGMGGHAKGEVASRMAVDVINNFLTDQITSAESGSLANDDFIKNILRDAVKEANKKIYDYSRSLPEKAIIGTTVSVVLFRNKKLYVAHVGDSRIYSLRKGVLETLTRDHTKAQELVDAGLLDKKEAENHRTSHLLTRSVGSFDMVTPDVNIFRNNNCDSLLLSTDGLFRVVGIDAVTEVMKTKIAPNEKCKKLVDMALEGGAPDNVSVIIIEQEQKSFFHKLFTGKS